MSNVLIGIIGVILFIGLALSSAVWLGPKFMNTKIEAEAVDYLNQSSQIARAVESYASDKGRLPIIDGKEPIEVLVEEKYMKYAPAGGASGWELNGSTQSILTRVAGAEDRATRVCVAARVKAQMPSPEKIYKCDGSDAPGGALSVKDPCCLM